MLLWAKAGVRARAAAVEGEAAAPAGLQELTKDNYESFLRDAGGTLVVVDFYTDWCNRRCVTHCLLWSCQLHVTKEG